jgi:hypothetical protein
MSTHDRKTIQEALYLDMTVIDSVRFSFATRKRLYFANFECLPESELPALDGSPVMSKELETAIPNQDEMLDYFEDQVIDSRFIETGAISHNETPFDKTLCIMPGARLDCPLLINCTISTRTKSQSQSNHFNCEIILLKIIPLVWLGRQR